LAVAKKRPRAASATGQLFGRCGITHRSAPRRRRNEVESKLKRKSISQ
jgi:hypothetical protein